MIFEQDDLAFTIFDVFFFDGSLNQSVHFGRNFDALSYRYSSDAVIESGGVHHELGDGSICFFPSNIRYTRTANRDRLIVLHFKAFNYHSNSVETFFPENSDKYVALFEELLSIWTSKKEAYRHRASSVLSQIFAEFYKDSEIAEAYDPRISAAVKYIESHFLEKDFSLKSAAKKSSISETYFRKLFKSSFGVSPKKYVIAQRIQYAASLILSGYFQLKTVADMCGYEDYKHFSTEFKKHTGVSPSEYEYNFLK